MMEHMHVYMGVPLSDQRPLKSPTASTYPINDV